ncbi:hypothetical protein AAZX31_13G163800 [Glycine max]
MFKHQMLDMCTLVALQLESAGTPDAWKSFLAVIQVPKPQMQKHHWRYLRFNQTHVDALQLRSGVHL